MVHYIMHALVLCFSSLLVVVSSVGVEVLDHAHFIRMADVDSGQTEAPPAAKDTGPTLSPADKKFAAEAQANATKRTNAIKDSVDLDWCKDKPPEKTGFNIWTDEGILGAASCTILADKCHNWINSSQVLVACPVTCALCDPNAKKETNGPPCYDSVVTGVRFKQGPQASCLDLARYCNHSTLFYHVQAACRKTCGLCEAHVGHVEGQCHDLEPNEEPEFRVGGQLARCPDLLDFCGGGLGNAYLIRHKCPKTCGMCPEQMTTSTHSSFTTSAEVQYESDSEPSDCQRRRRWGFCSTRRRRNL